MTGVIKRVAASARLFYNEHEALLISLCVLAGLLFLLWQYGTGPWSEFGLNAFTEILGIIVTIFLVDQILKSQERRRLWPLQTSAFRDVQTFVNEITGLWLNAYNWSGKGELSPPAKPPATQEFLTIPYFQAIRQRLNLDKDACVFPNRSWWEYLPQAENKIRQNGENILERHAAVLDPVAYGLVHKVLNGMFNPNTGLNMLNPLRETSGFVAEDEWQQLPESRRHLLGHYWYVTEESVKDVADLYAWYRINIKLYLGHD